MRRSTPMRRVGTVGLTAPRADHGETAAPLHASFRLLYDFLVPPAALAPTDVIFCFGSLDVDVPRRAARLYARGLAPWVLVTGRGRLPDGLHTDEADLFRRILLDEGVPAERIVVEPRASNMGENVRFGMEVLQGRTIEVRSASLVAWSLSLRRCTATFARWFPEVRTYPVPSRQGVLSAEAIGAPVWRAAVGELRRLETYPALGFISPQPIPESVREAARGLVGGTA